MSNTTANFDVYATKYCFKKKKGLTDKAKNIKFQENQIELDSNELKIAKIYFENLKKLFNIDLRIFIDEYMNNEMFSGGLFSINNFDEMFNVPFKQIESGLGVQSQHSDNKYIQLKITLDHLVQDKDYYIKLKAANL